MTVLGSVFLGDAHHHRVFSTTPPTSPPPSSLSPGFPVRAQQAGAEAVSSMDELKSDTQTSLPPEISSRLTLESIPVQAQQGRAAMDQPVIEGLVAEISPEVTLELRVRWLEALLLGIRPEATREVRKHVTEGRGTKEEAQKRESLFRRAEDVQRRLDAIVTSNDGLKRFMEHCSLPTLRQFSAWLTLFHIDDEHAQFLTPSFALSGPSSSLSPPPTYSSMSSVEFDAFLSDMEGDIRGADRDLREIDALEKRGVTGAGKLVGE